jgi:hypothetical protein
MEGQNGPCALQVVNGTRAAGKQGQTGHFGREGQGMRVSAVDGRKSRDAKTVRPESRVRPGRESGKGAKACALPYSQSSTVPCTTFGGFFCCFLCRCLLTSICCA